jgi:hypothetical protein
LRRRQARARVRVRTSSRASTTMMEPSCPSGLARTTRQARRAQLLPGAAAAAGGSGRGQRRRAQRARAHPERRSASCAAFRRSSAHGTGSPAGGSDRRFESAIARRVADGVFHVRDARSVCVWQRCAEAVCGCGLGAEQQRPLAWAAAAWPGTAGGWEWWAPAPGRSVPAARCHDAVSATCGRRATRAGGVTQRASTQRVLPPRCCGSAAEGSGARAAQLRRRQAHWSWLFMSSTRAAHASRARRTQTRAAAMPLPCRPHGSTAGHVRCGMATRTHDDGRRRKTMISQSAALQLRCFAPLHT